MRTSLRVFTGAILVLLAFASGLTAGGLRIESVRDARSGWPTPVSITADSLGFQPTRFDLLIAVDQTATGVITAKPGQMVEDCGWEYFNYRIIPDSNIALDLQHTTHVLQITGLASSAAPVPSCYGPDDEMELVRLSYWVSSAVPLKCEYTPVRFVWRDCFDNRLVDAADGSSHSAAHLAGPFPDTTWFQGWLQTQQFPGFHPPDDTCSEGVNPATVADIDFYSGGIDLICVDSGTPQGDMNLNGIRYEAADLIVYCNYFLGGIMTFFAPLPQTYVSDINYDGYNLSVTDLVLLWRIVAGDEFPVSKVSPSTARASITVQTQGDGATLELDSDQPIGVAYLRLVADDGSSVTAEPLVANLASGQIGDTTTALLMDISSMNTLSAGSHELLRLDRSDITVAEIELYDSQGQRIQTDVAGMRPEQFELYQNYPNPFNPQTNISFRLRERTRWTLTILNTLGQTVKTFEGTDAGTVQVVWRGDNTAGGSVSSGVYYYRLETQGQTATRPMVLLR